MDIEKYRVPLPCWTCGKDMIHSREVAQRYHDAGMKDRYCPTGGYHPQELYEPMKIDIIQEVIKKVAEAFDELENTLIFQEQSLIMENSFDIPKFLPKIAHALEEDYAVDMLKLQFDNGHFIFNIKYQIDNEDKSLRGETHQGYIVDIFPMGDSEFLKWGDPMEWNPKCCKHCEEKSEDEEED